jgi:hypothetical protein
VPYKIDALHSPRLGRNAERLSNYFTASEILLCKSAIGFEGQGDGLSEVRSGFVEGGTLGIGTRELFDESDVPFWNALKDCRELELHRGPLMRDSENLRGVSPNV